MGAEHAGNYADRKHRAEPLRCSARTIHEGESAPKDQLPFRSLSHVPGRLCRELPYGLPGTLPLAEEHPTRSRACAPSRWRAISHSETLYRLPRVGNEKAVDCLVRRRAWSGSM